MYRFISTTIIYQNNIFTIKIYFYEISIKTNLCHCCLKE
ncbi:hypothetical protein SPE_0074 [Spiroplasma eriocheiris CCTCC M 207170]|nr:hypothetical protein SPE_0074 [Spiroplasma eriocheiris CCTCC M 207170]